MAISNEQIDDASQAITIITGLDGLSTVVTQEILISSCPALSTRLQNGETRIELPDHDMDTFDALLKWIYEGIVDEPWDNSDAIGLMQIYDLASSLETTSACMDILSTFVGFVSRTRLSVHVINETSYIPMKCDLRDYLRVRLLEELEYLYDEKLLAEIDDVEGSLWQERCVARKLAGIQLKKQLEDPTAEVSRHARNELARKIEFDFLTPEQQEKWLFEKEKKYVKGRLHRVSHILGWYTVSSLTRCFVPHNAIDDEEINQLWTDGWHLKHSQGDWNRETENGGSAESEDSHDFAVDSGKISIMTEEESEHDEWHGVQI